MALRQHPAGKERTEGFKRLKSVKHTVLVDRLEAAGETLRRATEKPGSRVKRSKSAKPAVLPGDDFEQLEKDTLDAMVSEILDLLGGRKILGSAIHSELDAHELLHRGLPRAALSSLVDNLHVIQVDEATEALGMSLRTLQRHKNMPVVLLDVQQSGRTWKFAEILAKATRVLGSQDEAEQWLRRPAIGLNQQRPIDLLTTPAGVKLVEDYLGRLEYDVYT
jgi:putative toxin-antitoxin system antitoxin component (TIGR02293 family)